MRSLRGQVVPDISVEVRRAESGLVEIHGHAGLEVGRIPIVRIRFVPPLLDGVGCCLREHGIPGDQLQRVDLALLVDDRLEYHCALQLLGARLARVDGPHAVNHLIVGVILRHLVEFTGGALGLCRGRFSRAGRG